MAVLLETTVGDIVIDLKTGDPLGPDSNESDGGSSIWGVIDGPAKRTFKVDFNPKLKHLEKGTVSLATAVSQKDPDERVAGSQFIITLGDKLDYLDGKAAVFGMVAEASDSLDKINETFCDEKGRPLVDIRIKHTIIIEDPFEDPPGLIVPSESPIPSKAQLATVRIGEDYSPEDHVDDEIVEKARREREARAQALTLEMVGDLPFAEVKPPENILFVCKLNPVTTDEDLELIFSRFGTILSCEVIRDKRTNDSLQYAFIEYEEQTSCEQAYFKMQGVLIDDHRIHVDFSQSVSKISDSWRSVTNSKRRARASGYGGITGLEKKRHYKSEVRERGSDKYGIIIDEDDIRRHVREVRRHEDKRYRGRSSSPGKNSREDYRRDRK